MTEQRFIDRPHSLITVMINESRVSHRVGNIRHYICQPDPLIRNKLLSHIVQTHILFITIKYFSYITEVHLKPYK